MWISTQLHLAFNNLAINQPQKSREHLDLVLQVDPHNVPAKVMKNSLLADPTEDKSEARELWNRPTDPASRVTLFRHLFPNTPVEIPLTQFSFN
jgi:hypothetical protein